jgi:DNA modification methylase
MKSILTIAHFLEKEFFMKNLMHVELFDIDKIKPYERNPRKNAQAVDAVAASIQEFGFRQPLVTDGDLILIVGHTRWLAAKKLGLKKIPVHIATDMSPQQVQAYRIADNKTNELAEWDKELLPLELADIQADGFDMTSIGFSDAELSKLLDNVDLSEPANAEDVPDAPVEAVTKPGDVWQLGQHRLICGDCTKVNTIAKLFSGERAQLCFTSPPYNAGENHMGGNKNMVESKYVGQDDDLTPQEYLELLTAFTDLAIAQCDYVMVNLQMIANNKLTIIEYLHEFREHFADKWAWYKPAAAPAYPPKVMTSALEDVFIFAAKKNPSRAIASASFDRGTLQNVYVGKTASNENENADVHAATMPLHLAEHAIRNFSQRGAVVYEPFCGTGTTIIACERLNRRGLAVEIEPRYCDRAVQRWANFTGKKAEKLQ